MSYNIANYTPCNPQKIKYINNIEEQSALLPMKFYEELIQVLRIFESQFITCDDLDFYCNFSNLTPEKYKYFYNKEYNRWKKSANKNVVYYLILHDCDSAPNQSLNILYYELSAGIRSTFSVYPCWPYFEEGHYLFPIDFERLKSLQSKGFCITYHCNAACRHNFSEKTVWDAFDEDVDYLINQGFNIRFYSAHGGPTSSDGRHNNAFFWPAHTKHKLISTHNVYGIGSLHYSDGALFRETRKDNGDIRKYLIHVTPGERHKILLHPRFYNAKDDTNARKLFSTHIWLKEYWNLYEKEKTYLYWKNIVKNFSIQKVRRDNGFY